MVTGGAVRRGRELEDPRVWTEEITGVPKGSAAGILGMVAGHVAIAVLESPAEVANMIRSGAQVAQRGLGGGGSAAGAAAAYLPQRGAAGGGGARPFALGIDKHLDSFAAEQGATTYKSFPGVHWKETVLEKLADPNTKILFNLEGPVEAWPGVSRAARGVGGATDWELLQIQQNPQYWNTIEWWQGGTQVPNPFQ